MDWAGGGSVEDATRGLGLWILTGLGIVLHGDRICRERMDREMTNTQNGNESERLDGAWILNRRQSKRDRRVAGHFLGNLEQWRGSTGYKNMRINA